MDRYYVDYQGQDTFTGKERDRETSFSYFGARYYDCDLSGLFLSVDPMSDKYPNLSPYAYCVWNPVKLVDKDGNFPIHIHAFIIVKSSIKLGLKGIWKIGIGGIVEMSAGTSIQADLFHWKQSNIHLDGYNCNGPNNPTDLVCVYNNAISNYSNYIKDENYVDAGESMHTIADFYSHSNYIELYAQYAQDNNLPTDIENIPTFSEAQKDEKLMSFLNGQLKTGIYPDDKNDLQNSHKTMNKDTKRKGNGGAEYIKPGHTMYEAAKATAEKESFKVMKESL